MNEERISRRAWLTIQACVLTGASIWAAQDAIASTAIEHPEWDMDEVKTYREWAEQT